MEWSLCPLWLIANSHTVLIRQVVIDYFNSRLDSLNSDQAGGAPEGHTDWSVNKVLELVHTFTQVEANA